MHYIKKTTEAILVVILIFLQSGCVKYTTELKGDMIGYVYSFNELGIPYDDNSRIKVSFIDDMDNPCYVTYTDYRGRFEMNGILAGTYNLLYEKDGFGTMVIKGIKHYGGKPTLLYESDQTVFIYKKFESSVRNIYVNNGSLVFELPVTVTEMGGWVIHVLYFSTEKNFPVSSSMYIKKLSIHSRDNGTTDYWIKSLILPFKSGEEVFVKVQLYTGSYIYVAGGYTDIWGIDTYFDYENNKTIYPNISEISDEFSFIMPE